MNQQPNILLFSIVSSVVFALMDTYVAVRWTKYVKQTRKSPWLYWAVWIITILMFCIYCYVVYRRHFFRLDGLDVVLITITSVWALSKIPIVLSLILFDFGRGLKWVTGTVSRFANKVIRRGTKAVQREDGSESFLRPLDPSYTDDEIERSASPLLSREKLGSLNRREFLRNTTWATASVPFVIVGNGVFRTLYDFRVEELEVIVRDLPAAMDGFRLVQISDVHAGSFPDHKPFQEVVHKINNLKPDAIVITGDFVNARPHELKLIAGELPKLRSQYGVLGVLGNHDHYNSSAEHLELVKSLRGMGVDLLVNENRTIKSGTGSLVIAGTDNTGFKQKFARLDKALGSVIGDEAVILLAHDPTFWDASVVGKKKVDLMLSGHTHGGQIGISIAGFEWSPAKMVYKQYAGMYEKGAQKLYVNRGVGTVGPPLRIGVPPEITLFILRTENPIQRMA